MKLLNNKTPRVSLVGAGPGDPELLTIKGLKAIKSADVILYDALCNEMLLEEAPTQTVKIFVGKRAGKHSFKQSEINLLLVQNAFRYGHAVRLKGGDPFVFGRGYEELEYIEAFDIPVELIPGISSSISLPALQKVPLTHRGLSEGFWVVTASTASGRLSNDIALAAQSSSTVVILMGMRKLKAIVEIYQSFGQGDLSVMIVQNGSLPTEKVAIGTIDTIESIKKENQLSTPAIIVIGEVVALRHRAALNKQFYAALSESK
mgnify:CR=1 FL=1